MISGNRIPPRGVKHTNSNNMLRVMPIYEERGKSCSSFDMKILNEKRLRSESLIKSYNELLQSSTSGDIEKIKESLGLHLSNNSSNELENKLLYCCHCFSIELNRKMITCTNTNCQKKFCLNCFRNYHIKHLEEINFNLTNGNWICFESNVIQRDNEESKVENGRCKKEKITTTYKGTKLNIPNKQANSHIKEWADVQSKILLNQMQRNKLIKPILKLISQNSGQFESDKSKEEVISGNISNGHNNDKNETKRFINGDNRIISEKCESNYSNKSMGEDCYERKCRYCHGKCNANELLNFASIRDFLQYIIDFSSFQNQYITYNPKVIQMNKEQIIEYIGKPNNYRKEWDFFSSKVFCKLCLIIILNKTNCIKTLSYLLKDQKEDNSQQNQKPMIKPTRYTNESKKLNDSDSQSIVPFQSPKKNYPTSISLFDAFEYLSAKEILVNEFTENYSSSTNLSVYQGNSTSINIPADFLKTIDSLSISILTSVQQLSNGAMLYNQICETSQISPNDFLEYFRKLSSINKSNNEKITNTLEALSKHKNYLYNILDFAYSFSSFNDIKQQSTSTNDKVKRMINKMENEFNKYNQLFQRYTKALNLLQRMTIKYLSNLIDQSNIFNYIINIG